MRNLYQIHDNGATFWVVTETWEQAIELVASQDDRDDFPDPPKIDYPLSSRMEAGPRRFAIDGEEEECSLWLAYLIVREYSDCILAGSEW